MLSSIHPLGERSRKNTWWLTATAHTIGSTAGGLVLGLTAGASGALIAHSAGQRILTALVLASAIVAVASDLAAQRTTWRLPSIGRQVNENWIGTYRGWVYGAGFGVQLGLAFATIVTSAIVYLLVPVTMLTADPTLGATVGGFFGLCRGASVWAMSGVHSRSALDRRHRMLNRLASPASLLAVTTQAAAVIVTSTLLVAA